MHSVQCTVSYLLSTCTFFHQIEVTPDITTFLLLLQTCKRHIRNHYHATYRSSPLRAKYYLSLPPILLRVLRPSRSPSTLPPQVDREARRTSPSDLHRPCHQMPIECDIFFACFQRLHLEVVLDVRVAVVPDIVCNLDSIDDVDGIAYNATCRLAASPTDICCSYSLKPPDYAVEAKLFRLDVAVTH